MAPSPAGRPRSALHHPWWRHVPPGQRTGRRLALVAAGLGAALRRRRNRIVLTVIFYFLLCLIPLHFRQPHLTLLGLLPLITVPPVAYLAYVIAWHEFHR